MFADKSNLEPFSQSFETLLSTRTSYGIKVYKSDCIYPFGGQRSWSSYVSLRTSTNALQGLPLVFTKHVQVVERVLNVSTKPEGSPRFHQHETAQGYVVQLEKPRQEKAFSTYEMSLTKPTKLSRKVKLTVSSEAENFTKELWFDLEEIDANNTRWELADEVSRSLLTIVIPKKVSKLVRSEIMQKRQDKRKENAERKALARRRLSGDQETLDLDAAFSECENLFRMYMFNESLETFEEQQDNRNSLTEQQALASSKQNSSGLEPETELNGHDKQDTSILEASESIKSLTSEYTKSATRELSRSLTNDYIIVSSSFEESNENENSQQQEPQGGCADSDRLKGLSEKSPETSQDLKESQDTNAAGVDLEKLETVSGPYDRHKNASEDKELEP